MTVADIPVAVEPGLSGFGGAGAHGGYVASLALRALRRQVAVERAPRSLTMHLLSPVEHGDLLVRSRELRSGSTLTAMAADLIQEGSLVGTATAAFGRVARGIERIDARPPGVPPPEACRPLFDKPVPEAQAGLVVEHRPAGPPLPLTGADEAEIKVWMRPADGRAIDPEVAVFLADSAPPGLYGALSDYVAMPSTEITVHFAPAAHEPGTEWALGVVRNVAAGAGYAVEDIELWSPDATLLAVSRQLRRVLVP